MADFAVIIAAAGASTRFGGREKKPFVKLDGRPLFLRSAEAFINRDDVCQTILAVAHEDYETVRSGYGANLGFMGVQLVEGGSARADTVRRALAAVGDQAKFVAVHDAVRVCVTSRMIDEVFAEATKSGAAILAAPVSGALKRVTVQGVVDQAVDRAGLYEAQTPQVFRREILEAAYKALDAAVSVADDAEVVALAGHAVTVVESDATNLKITFPADLHLAGAILKSRPKLRTGGPRGPFEEAQW
jgi:2-C-methyl-D-erythritol 4-phosphate cytidylyltransferase